MRKTLGCVASVGVLLGVSACGDGQEIPEEVQEELEQRQAEQEETEADEEVELDERSQEILEDAGGNMQDMYDHLVENQDEYSDLLDELYEENQELLEDPEAEIEDILGILGGQFDDLLDYFDTSGLTEEQETELVTGLAVSSTQMPSAAELDENEVGTLITLDGATMDLNEDTMTVAARPSEEFAGMFDVTAEELSMQDGNEIQFNNVDGEWLIYGESMMEADL